MPKRITMKDIAQELGVSVTTISKAINNHPDISPARRRQIQSLLAEKSAQRTDEIHKPDCF